MYLIVKIILVFYAGFILLFYVSNQLNSPEDNVIQGIFRNSSEYLRERRRRREENILGLDDEENGRYREFVNLEMDDSNHHHSIFIWPHEENINDGRLLLPDVPDNDL